MPRAQSRLSGLEPAMHSNVRGLLGGWQVLSAEGMLWVSPLFVLDPPAWRLMHPGREADAVLHNVPLYHPGACILTRANLSLNVGGHSNR